MSRIRLMLVDDHQMVRAGLRALLGDEPGIEIVGEAATVADAIEGAARWQPRVVLMDLRLPDGSGIDACREILSAAPLTRILFLTSHSDRDAMLSTVLAGACGYLLKDIGRQALLRAIEDAANDRPVLDSKSADAARRNLLDSKGTEPLSPQESRVLALVAEGRTNKEIAASLGLSDKTVKNYLSNAFQKLGVTRRSQAAALFARGVDKGADR